MSDDLMMKLRKVEIEFLIQLLTVATVRGPDSAKMLVQVLEKLQRMHAEAER